jgi:hypothetical protein
MIYGLEELPSQSFANFAGLQNTQLPLNKGDVVKKWYLKFNATVNVTTAGATVAFNDYGWYNLLEKIKLQINSANIFEWSPYMFYFADAFLTDNQSYSTDLPTAADMEATGSYNLEIVIPIHLNQPKTSTPSASLLPLITSSGVKDANVSIVYGTYNSIFSAATGTVPTYNLSNISINILQDKVINGNPTLIAGNKLFINQFSTKTTTFNSSSDNYQVDLPANKKFRAVCLEFLDSNTFIGDDSICSNISVYSGNNELVKNISWADFKNNYYQHYPTDRLANITTTGRVFMDFAFEEKTLANVVSTMNNYQVYFKFNIAKAGLLNTYYWTMA